MSKRNSVIKKLEGIVNLDTDKIGDEHHPLSLELLENTQEALLNVQVSGTDEDKQRYVRALENHKVQRVLGLRKEV